MPRSITTFRQVLVAAAVLTAAAPFAATAASAAGGDGETVKPVAAHDLPNLPGKRLAAVVVTYAPCVSSCGISQNVRVKVEKNSKKYKLK